jgi:hypothetical protein
MFELQVYFKPTRLVDEVAGNIILKTIIDEPNFCPNSINIFLKKDGANNFFALYTRK